MAKSIFGQTLKFLAAECQVALLTDVHQAQEKSQQVAPGVQEVMSFLRLLSSLLNRHMSREDWEKTQIGLSQENGECHNHECRSTLYATSSSH